MPDTRMGRNEITREDAMWQLGKYYDEIDRYAHDHGYRMFVEKVLMKSVDHGFSAEILVRQERCVTEEAYVTLFMDSVEVPENETPETDTDDRVDEVTETLAQFLNRIREGS